MNPRKRIYCWYGHRRRVLFQRHSRSTNISSTCTMLEDRFVIHSPCQWKYWLILWYAEMREIKMDSLLRQRDSGHFHRFFIVLRSGTLWIGFCQCNGRGTQPVGWDSQFTVVPSNVNDPIFEVSHILYHSPLPAVYDWLCPNYSKCDLFRIKLEEQQKDLRICFKEYGGDNSYADAVSFVRTQVMKWIHGGYMHFDDSSDDEYYFQEWTVSDDRYQSMFQWQWFFEMALIIWWFIKTAFGCHSLCSWIEIRRAERSSVMSLVLRISTMWRECSMTFRILLSMRRCIEVVWCRHCHENEDENVPYRLMLELAI